MDPAETAPHARHPQHRRFTNAQVAAIAAAYAAQHNAAQVAREYRTTADTVQRIATTQGVKIAQQNRVVFTKEELADILKSYAARPNVLALAHRYHVSASVIYRVLRENGVTVVKRRGRRPTLAEENVQDVIARYTGTGRHEGRRQSMPEIAQYYSVSSDVIYRTLKDRNIKARPSAEGHVRPYFSPDGDLDALARDLGVEPAALHRLMVQHRFFFERS